MYFIIFSKTCSKKKCIIPNNTDAQAHSTLQCNQAASPRYVGPEVEGRPTGGRAGGGVWGAW